jgi:hypothetical protein
MGWTQARQIFRLDKLDVFNSMGSKRGGGGTGFRGLQFLENFDQLAVGAIANGVNCHCESRCLRPMNGAGNLLDGGQLQPGAVGAFVGFEQPGCARSLRSICKVFDMTNAEIFIAEPRPQSR